MVRAHGGVEGIAMQAEVAAQDVADASPDCPLTEREQVRNMILFAISTSLLYLSSPVTFAVVHAPLCERLGAPAKIANLPTSAYLLMAAVPVFVAWAYPQVRHFKLILVVSYFGLAAATGFLAVLLPL